MSDLKVSVCAPDDLGALVESVTGLFHDDAGQHDPCLDLTWPVREGTEAYGAVLDDPGALLLLAWDGLRPVGHLVGKLREPVSIRPCRHAVLESLRVLPERRGHGVGSRLVREFLDWARRHGARHATVTAYAANHGARRFYTRHGFVGQEASMRAPL